MKKRKSTSCISLVLVIILSCSNREMLNINQLKARLSPEIWNTISLQSISEQRKLLSNQDVNRKNEFDRAFSKISNFKNHARNKVIDSMIELVVDSSNVFDSVYVIEYYGDGDGPFLSISLLFFYDTKTYGYSFSTTDELTPHKVDMSLFSSSFCNLFEFTISNNNLNNDNLKEPRAWSSLLVLTKVTTRTTISKCLIQPYFSQLELLRY